MSAKKYQVGKKVLVIMGACDRHVFHVQKIAWAVKDSLEVGENSLLLIAKVETVVTL